jgi:hypothetical protein
MRRRTTPRKTAVPAFVPPYPPSWVDRLTALIDRAPGPAWLTFLLLGLGAVLLQQWLQTSGGDYQPGRYLLLHLWVSGNFAYLLAMIFYLDRAAASAIEAFRPVLRSSHPDGTADDDALTLSLLRYRLTTMPPRPAIWAGVAGVVVIGLGSMVSLGGSPQQMMATFGGSLATVPLVSFFGQFFLTQAIAGVLIYHTIRQLRLIDHVYRHHTRLNLYRLQPLYAFSVLSALTAGGILIYNYAWFAASPDLLEQNISLVEGVFFSGIAALAFAWPLWGIHRRLVDEKKRLLQESSSRFEAAVSQLHRRVDRGRLNAMDDLNKALASLEIEQAALHRVPTWPWEPGTIRGLVAALLVPIVIWLTQIVLQRFIG